MCDNNRKLLMTLASLALGVTLAAVALVLAANAGAPEVHAAPLPMPLADSCISPTGVAIGSDSPVALGEAMHFTTIVTPSDTTNPTFAWDFGGAATVSGATTAAPVVTYTALGDYTVQVTVTGDCDAPVVDSVIVSVESRVYLPLALRDHASGRYAVIVGIADYPGTANDLNYTDDDATEFRQMLLSEGGFQSSDILMLLDSAATSSAIQNAITNWLDSREGPADLVVFFFSGHGSRGPDVSGDEDDPYDEYLVAYDTMIRDDVLDSWLDTLESSRQVVIVDSCYSGGLIAASSVQEGLQCRCLPSQGGPLVGVLPGDGFARDVDQSGRVVLTASAETEYSYESSGLQNGVFTYYLLDALDDLTADTHDSNGRISAEEAYDYLYPRVRSYLGNVQNPQMSDGVSGEVDLTQP